MQSSYNGIPVPTDGQAIEYANGKFTIPDHPIIPFIEGDGIGVDITPVMLKVVDAEEPPLRVFFGVRPLDMAKADYASRIATWEKWNDVSIEAQG